jgi:hypothetical protein
VAQGYPLPDPATKKTRNARDRTMHSISNRMNNHMLYTSESHTSIGKYFPSSPKKGSIWLNKTELQTNSGTYTQITSYNERRGRTEQKNGRTELKYIVKTNHHREISYIRPSLQDQMYI